MIEEGFSLGDSDFTNIQDDFSLGNATEDSFALPSSTPKKSFEKRTPEVERIYKLLKIDDKKDAKQDWKEYFKSNVEIFTVAGKNYYETLNENEFKDFEKKCEQWIGEAHENWIQIENQGKIENLTDALHALISIFRTSAATEDFTKKIRHNLSSHLNTLLAQKVNDGILEISEILELQETAVRIHLVQNSDSGKKSVVDWINRHKEKEGFAIESFSETFVRLVSELPELERLNTEATKEKLFAEYKKLAEINNQVSSDKVSLEKNELYPQMCNLLAQKNLLVDNVSFYTENFFNAEKALGKFNFSLPIVAQEYYYLKGTAHNLYHFSENQWNDFVRKNEIIKESDASVVFIMGTEKASDVLEIAALLEENPNMALSRIRAGDVETFLLHIRQIDMAKKLSAIKEALKNDTDILVQGVVNLLRGKDSQSDETEDEASPADSLLPLIESGASAEEIVSYLLRRKQYENLNRKILSPGTKDHRELENYLVSSGFSFIKICMNYLHQFPAENNALAYKNMYETYADYVLSKLVSENDFMTFLYVFKPVLEEIDKTEYLSADFIKKFDEIETQMMEMPDDEKTSQQTEVENKPKKSFLWFKK